LAKKQLQRKAFPPSNCPPINRQKATMQIAEKDLFLLSQCAISAACQAGHLITKYAQQSFAINTKNAGTSLAAQVVTEVDHLSQEIILNILRPVADMYDFAILSEETPDDGQRLHKAAFWCIDPLDGTLPFIESLPGYSVSIALVSRSGEPLIGIVYDPLTQTIFHAGKSTCVWQDNQAIKPIALPTHREQTLVFLTDKSFAEDSRYASTITKLNHIAEELGYADAILKLQGGAAMNACQVLTGAAACYFKFPKPQLGGGSIWDYGATACLFKAAGLPFSDAFGQALILNPEGSTFMNHCGVLYSQNQDIAQRMIQAYQDYEFKADCS
jgi:myo-inositol-1(or 4)-monophosphatase